MSKPWGKILVGTRLEKVVLDEFFSVWTSLLMGGLRKGDKYAIAKGMTAHKAANSLAASLLKSDCDSLFFLDSDADIDRDFLSRFRDYEPGWKYDIFQAFYLRRQWPPDAVWLTRDSEGILRRVLVLDEATEDISLAGLHATLIRREVFEKLLPKGVDPEKHDWFYYPRHTRETEDAPFSADALKAGFRIGATSVEKAGHITQLTIGWETYQEYLLTSGTWTRISRYNDLMQHMIDFTGLSEDKIANLAAAGSKNVREAWEDYKPKGSQATRDFYGVSHNGYLFDLFNWNTSMDYIKMTEPLAQMKGETVLVVGAGLGGEAALLMDANEVEIYELPGVLKEFSQKRLGDKVKFLDGESITSAFADTKRSYSLIVAIDVIEHVHPDEIQEFLETIDSILQPGGALYCHCDFGRQDIYPMHFDHSEVFSAWAAKAGLVKENNLVWRKPGKEFKQ